MTKEHVDVTDLWYLTISGTDTDEYFYPNDWWSIEGNRDHMYGDELFEGQPCLWIGNGKYTVLVENWSDEVEVYPIVDLTGFRMAYTFYGSGWSENWRDQYFEAMNGNREAIDFIMRQGMVEEGFRTMTAYGYDFEGWDLNVDWDLNDAFVQCGASVVGRSIYEEEPLRPLV